MVMFLVPCMVTNLKAGIDGEIAVTDASPSGGGAAVATEFRRPPNTLEVDKGRCYECGKRLGQGDRYPCPAECGGVFCSLACVMEHRDVDHETHHECPRRAWRPPRFGERFAGKRAPLSHAVATEGHIEVQEPFDLHFGHNMFTDEGRDTLQRLCDDEFLEAEHWAPECRLFSKARGKPIVLSSGREIAGPQPVRDHRHLMGFPWLSTEMKARVRQSNSMVLKAIKRAMLRKGSATGQWSIPMVLGSGNFSCSRRLKRTRHSLTQWGLPAALGGLARSGSPSLETWRPSPRFSTKIAQGILGFSRTWWRSYLMAASASTPRKRQSIPGNFAELMPGPFGGRLTWTALFRTWSSVSARGTTRTSSPRPPAAWLPRW